MFAVTLDIMYIVAYLIYAHPSIFTKIILSGLNQTLQMLQDSKKCSCATFWCYYTQLTFICWVMSLWCFMCANYCNKEISGNVHPWWKIFSVSSVCIWVKALIWLLKCRFTWYLDISNEYMDKNSLMWPLSTSHRMLNSVWPSGHHFC